jgi:probable rRNA maturation factor
MINIDVISEEKSWFRNIKKKKEFFNSIIKSFPKKYRFTKKKINLTILLSNNKNIKKLNYKFRGKNKPTDVLSFPLGKKYTANKDFYLGDIIISYEFMRKPKAIKNDDFKEKVAQTFIHGFLHLLGFNHIKIKDYKKMINEEKKIYKLVKLKIAKLV